MKKSPEHWPALSFLECLRPAPDEEIEVALLASYSADLGSIGAALLALAGNDNTSGRGSPSDFADAVDRLRGKVRIVIQRGRLASMPRTPRVAAVLDQFVREVDFDEATHSWHPKAALLRTRRSDGQIAWRLWIGSRNLTEHVNREIGLLLLADGAAGRQIEGVDALAFSLAQRASLKGVRPNALRSAVAKVAWRAPAGVRVERLCWSAGGGGQTPPTPPEGTDEVVVVSPFVGKEFLALQMRRGTARTVLLTTMLEVERLGPALQTLDDLLVLDAPDYAPGDSEAETDVALDVADSAPNDNAGEELGRGLHAKLLFMRSGRTRRLWLGSANATMRAWTGRNAELTAQLLVTEPVERGLRALLGSARLVKAPTKEFEMDAAATEAEALERARAQVAARWAAQLSFDNEDGHLAHVSEVYPVGPHPDEHDIQLEVATLYGELFAWPRGQRLIALGHVPAAERTELVRIRISRSGKGLSWLQRATVEPALGEDRDRAAFVRALGAKGFLLWLAGVLADDGRDEEGDWTIDAPRKRKDPNFRPGLDTLLPTLEEMLAAWARDPGKFKDIERKVAAYLPALRQEARRESAEVVETLRRFDDLWTKLCEGLSIKGSKGRRS